MVKYRFSAPHDMGSNPIRCYRTIYNNIIIIYIIMSRKGIEPLSQKLQTYAFPLSYLDFILKLKS
jgi:hypothetical protein